MSPRLHLRESISADKNRWSQYGDTNNVKSRSPLVSPLSRIFKHLIINIFSFFTKCSGKVNGRDGVTHREDALREVQVLGSGGRWGPPPQEREQPPLHQPWTHRALVRKCFWFPSFLPRQARCLWLGEGSLLPLLSASLTGPALLQPWALGTVRAA